MKRFFLCIGLVAGSIFTGSMHAWANTPTPTAQELIKTAVEKAQEFDDVVSTVEMTTVEKNGKEHHRKMQIKVLKKNNGEVIKSLMIFLEPARERGVALLSHLYADEAITDQQWLYLPNLRKSKPIIGSNRDGAFMGSEFSYGDLAPQATQQYNYKEVVSATFEGQPHWIIEATPKSNSSAYSKQIIWLNQASFIATKTEFYNTSGKLWKVLRADKLIIDHEGRERPSRLIMSNLLNQRKTILKDSEYKTNTGLQESIFEEIELPFTL